MAGCVQPILGIQEKEWKKKIKLCGRNNFSKERKNPAEILQTYFIISISLYRFPLPTFLRKIVANSLTDLLADFSYHKFSKRLSVSICAAVMLFWLHFINNDLGPFQVFQNFSFHSDTFKIRLANMEFTINLQGQHAAKVNLTAFRCLQGLIN